MLLNKSASRIAPAHRAAGRRVPSLAAPRRAEARRAKLAAAAAASSDEGAPAAAAPAPAAQQRERRQSRQVTVDLATLQPGDELPGTVTAVEAYGAFVNVGARSDGLVHVSQLSDGYVRNVSDVVSVGAQVKVKVMSVDASSGRLALTMKGVEGNPKPAAPAGGAGAGAARGGGRGAGAGRGQRSGGARGASASADADDAADELEANEAFVEGITLRFDDAAADAAAAGYGEADVEALEMLPASGAAALAVNDLVEGVVKEVQDFGVILEFTGPDGAAAQGLLHVSEMAAPASKLAQDAADKPASAEGAGEAEFAGAEYEDVGGVDDPKKYYAVGDKVRAFVLDVAESGGRAELTQFVYDEADGALLVRAGLLAADDDGDRLLERVARAAGGEAELPAAAPSPRGRGSRFAEEDSEAALADVGELSVALPSEAAEATLFYGQASSYPDRAVAGLVAPGAPLAPGAFPDRPLRAVKDVSLMTPQVGEVEVGDGGEESELVDFWTLDYAPADSRLMRKGALRKIGARLEKAGEEQGGGWSVQPIEGAEEVNPSAYFELLSPVGGADVDAIVDDLLADDEDLGEAELPALAMRRPAAVYAAATAISAGTVKALREKTGAGMMDCKKALSESEGDMDKAVEWLRKKGLSGADKKAGRIAAEGAVVKYIHPGSRIGILMEVNCETDFVAASDEFRKLCAELCMIAASSDVVCVSAEDVPADLLAKEREIEMGKADLATKPEGVRAKIVEGRLDKLKKQWALLEQDALTAAGTKVEDLVKATIAKVGENVKVRRFIKYTLGEGIEKKASNLAAEVAEQTAAMAAKAAEAAKAPKAAAEEKKAEADAPKQPAVAVSASAVKALRDKSGAGMMDCKKALAENGNDVDKASEWLRKKGLAGADKKAGRVAAEGAVVEYIHPGSRVGVLLELNCETDFVAAGEVFQKLAKALAMQIAASPTVEYVAAEEIPAEVFETEMKAEMAREDIAAKPEAIRAKIAEGRVKKIVAERALLDQPYLVDQSKTVAEAIKEAIAACGEKISVRRFTRYVLGEGIEKKSTDLAADVAAMAGAGKA